jgi:hypothetical protein
MSEEPTDKKTLGELTPAEMHELIDKLPRKQPMRDEMYVGTEFFRLLLDKHGKEAVVQCVERLHKELRDGGPLEDYDFLDKSDGVKDKSGAIIDELALLKLARRRSLALVHPKARMSRRDFFETAGWATLATYWMGTGALKTGDEVTRAITRDDKPTWAGQAHDKIKAVADGPADVLLGATALSTVASYWAKLKLEHVANAIDEMAKHLGPDRKDQPSQER